MASKKNLGISTRKLLYKLLPFHSYLWVLSKSFLYLYKYGFLKSNPFFEYHYFLKNIIKENDVCIDIGANLGYYTVPMADIAGQGKDKGMIYAVEPIEPALRILRQNTKKHQNVTILPYALGNEDKKIHLGNNSLNKSEYISTGKNFVLENDHNANMQFQAEMKRGSILFQDLDKLDFIKCDVEGYEMHILPEMQELIFKFRPILLVESGGDNRKKIIDLFSKNNYTVFVLKNGFLYNVEQYNKRDLIIIPQEKISQFKKYIHNPVSPEV